MDIDKSVCLDLESICNLCGYTNSELRNAVVCAAIAVAGVVMEENEEDKVEYRLETGDGYTIEMSVRKVMDIRH